MNQAQRVIVVDTFITNLRVLKNLAEIYRESECRDEATVKLLDEFEAYVSTFGNNEAETFKYLIDADTAVFSRLAEWMVQIQHKLFMEASDDPN